MISSAIWQFREKKPLLSKHLRVMGDLGDKIISKQLNITSGTSS